MELSKEKHIGGNFRLTLTFEEATALATALKRYVNEYHTGTPDPAEDIAVQIQYALFKYNVQGDY